MAGMVEIPHLALMIAAALALGVGVREKPGFAAMRENFLMWRGLWRQRARWPAPLTGAFWLAPALSLASVLLAAALTPSFTTALPGAALASLPLLAGLLGLSALAPGLALLEGGTTAGGLALGWRLGFGVLATPILFLVLWSLAQLAGGVLIGGISAEIAAGAPLAPRLLGLLALAALARCAPEPLPCPDHAGRARAAFLAAAALRRVVLCSLIADLFFPAGLAGTEVAGWGIGILAWVIKAGAVALAGSALAPARPAARRPSPTLLSPELGAAWALALGAALSAAFARGAA